jgi:hypothetical protein
VLFLKDLRFISTNFYSDNAFFSVVRSIVEVKQRESSAINRSHAIIFSLGELSYYSRRHNDKPFTA